MKSNVLRREYPSAEFQTPEEKIERLTGSLSTKINLKESLGSRHDSFDRTMYTTNSTWARNRRKGDKRLKPLEHKMQQKGDIGKNSVGRVKQVFYWGHERKPPPQRNSPTQTNAASQVSSSKLQFDPQFEQDNTRYGKALYSRQVKVSSQSQSGSCPTQIYSKFKSIHSEKMNRVYQQQVNINGDVQMDHYARKRPHLQPLMLGYTHDKPRIENTSHYNVTERAPAWKSDVLLTSSAMSTTESHSNTWPMNTDVEGRHADRWSPLNSSGMVPIRKANSLSYEDRWDFVEWPAPPPNSVTPSSFETSQPPPNTPYDWY